MIKKFSAWPSSVQNKIKIVFASYRNKAQNTTCTMWLLGYEYLAHLSVWTKCLSDGVQNANTRTAHKFSKNFSNDTDVAKQKFISQLVIQDETWIRHLDSESERQIMQWNERIGQNCHFLTLRNSVLYHVICKQPTTAKMHKIFTGQESYVHVVFWASLL